MFCANSVQALEKVLDNFGLQKKDLFFALSPMRESYLPLANLVFSSFLEEVGMPPNILDNKSSQYLALLCIYNPHIWDK